MSKLDIRQIDFEWMNPLSSYVAITVAVGPRNQGPYSRIMKQLKHFRGESRLCELLDSLGITYDIMPAFVECFSDGSAIQVTHDDVEEKIECAVDDVRCEAMSAVEELRDDLDQVGALEEKCSSSDFGFTEPEQECYGGEGRGVKGTSEEMTNFGYAENGYDVGQSEGAVSDASQAKMMSNDVGRGTRPVFKARELTKNEEQLQQDHIMDTINSITRK